MIDSNSRKFSGKMMVTFFVAFLLNIIAYAQVSGEIEYGVRYTGMLADTSKITDRTQLSKVIQLENEAKAGLAFDETYCVLRFEGSNSYFKKVPKMELDNHIGNFYIGWGGYLKINNKLYEENGFNKQSYYVDVTVNPNWKLKNEYCTFLGYKCQKAEATINWRGELRKLIAWFTTKIPVSVGPYYSYGLPGLILAMEYKGRFHYARKINLNKDVNIEIPEKKYLITRDEYFNLYD